MSQGGSHLRAGDTRSTDRQRELHSMPPELPDEMAFTRGQSTEPNVVRPWG